MKTILTLFITFIAYSSFSQITYYSERSELHSNCSGSLILEDFEGGPADSGNTGCDGDFSSEGNNCFAAGEIQQGIVITSSDNTAETPMVYTNVGFVSNPTPIVGTNNFDDFTIVNFPEGNIDAVALDLYGAPFASVMHVRIYNFANEIIDTLMITEGMPGPYFFGLISSEPIASIEFQAEGSSVEMVGMVEFGTCSTTAINNLKNNNIHFFPNPVKNRLTLTSSSVIQQIEVFDVLGHKVKEISSNSLVTTLDFSDLESGNYYINVKIKGGTKVFKLIKE